MIYYGIKENKDFYGFYLSTDDLTTYVELSDDEHYQLMVEANKQNKKIVADENGYPILVDYPEPTDKEKAEREIQSLQSYLTSTDWYAIRFADTGESVPPDIKAERQKARERISELRKIVEK